MARSSFSRGALSPPPAAPISTDIAKLPSVWLGAPFGGRNLVSDLASPEGQAAIAGYTIAGQRLFHPESDPKPQN